MPFRFVEAMVEEPEIKEDKEPTEYDCNDRLNEIRDLGLDKSDKDKDKVIWYNSNGFLKASEIDNNHLFNILNYIDRIGFNPNYITKEMFRNLLKEAKRRNIGHNLTKNKYDEVVTLNRRFEKKEAILDDLKCLADRNEPVDRRYVHGDSIDYEAMYYDIDLYHDLH